VLLTVKNALQPLNILQLCFADMRDPQLAFTSKQNEISAEKQVRECAGMVGRAQSRCLGLIEITGFPQTDPCFRNVQFLHKSVSDFLDTPKVQSRISECLGGKDFVPELQLMRASLLELKTVETRLSEHDFHHGGGLKREAWFDNVVPIVVAFMHYAGWAEEKMNAAQVALVDEVDRVTTTLWESVNFRSDDERACIDHWYKAPRKPGAIGFDKDPLPASRNSGDISFDPEELLPTLPRITWSPPEIEDDSPLSSESDSSNSIIDTPKERLKDNLCVHFDVSIPPLDPTREHTRFQAQHKFWAQLEVPSYASNSSCGFEAFARTSRLDLYVRAKYGSHLGELSPQGPGLREQKEHDAKVGGTECAILEGRPWQQEKKRGKRVLRFFRSVFVSWRK
jgi:hypothetical protein